MDAKDLRIVELEEALENAIVDYDTLASGTTTIEAELRDHRRRGERIGMLLSAAWENPDPKLGATVTYENVGFGERHIILDQGFESILLSIPQARNLAKAIAVAAAPRKRGT